MIRKLSEKLTGLVTGPLDRAWSALPSVSLIKSAEIPVYVVHQSRDPEDYVFFFDFQRFMAESQKGWFVRPVLKIWAGRSDFERMAFARALREAFTAQFSRMQDALLDEIEEEERQKRGWGWLNFEFLPGLEWGLALGTGWVQILLLFLAVTTGAAALAELKSRIGAIFRRKLSPEERLKALHEEIEAKRRVVDEALARTEISLHRDLYLQAWQGGPAGPMRGIDLDAWPLPERVKAHLEDGVSGSWW